MAKILVIDDDAEIREMICEKLDEHDVSEAFSGNDGVSSYEVQHPDLIITDLVMAGSDGFHTIESIRKNDLITPIVVCSGFPENESLALESGANAFLCKPFTLDRLNKVVNSLLE